MKDSSIHTCTIASSGAGEWYDRKGTNQYLKTQGLPEHHGALLWAYAKGHPCLTEQYARDWEEGMEGLRRLSETAIRTYQSELETPQGDALGFLYACTRLNRIPYSLFAHLCGSFHQSSFRLIEEGREHFFFQEEKGCFILYPFFRDYVVRMATLHLQPEEQRFASTKLIEGVLAEKGFLPEYIFLGDTVGERTALEEGLSRSIVAKGVDGYRQSLLGEPGKILQSLALRALRLYLGPKDPGVQEADAWLKDLFGHRLYPILVEERIRYRCRQLSVGDIPPEDSRKDPHLEAVQGWLMGKAVDVGVPVAHYGKWGFEDVPDHLLHGLEDLPLLKEGVTGRETFLRRVTVLYAYYLRGEYRRGGKLFFHLLKHDRSFLIGEFRHLRYLLLAHHFYGRGRLEKSKWFLEEVLLLKGESGEQIFLLKVLGLYHRIIMDQKDVKALQQLLDRSKTLLTRAKPCVAFLQLLKSSRHLLVGEGIGDGLETSIQYSIGIGDAVAAVQYFSYVVSAGDPEQQHLVRIQEGLLDQAKLAVYHNTSILGNYRRIPLVIRFFGSFRLIIGGRDCSREFQVRKKLRKIFNYLIHRHPNKVSREELKRVFWDKEKSFDLDANLRVALSSIRKILSVYGFGDLLVVDGGMVSLHPRYDVQCDFKSYQSAFRKAKALYDNGQVKDGELFFRRLIQSRQERVFGDLAWEYLENLVHQQVLRMQKEALVALVDIAMEGKELDQAESYARRLYGLDPRYGSKLAKVLELSGRGAAECRKLREKPKGEVPLESIFFPE